MQKSKEVILSLSGIHSRDIESASKFIKNWQRIWAFWCFPAVFLYRTKESALVSLLMKKVSIGEYDFRLRMWMTTRLKRCERLAECEASSG